MVTYKCLLGSCTYTLMCIDWHVCTPIHLYCIFTEAHCFIVLHIYNQYKSIAENSYIYSRSKIIALYVQDACGNNSKLYLILCNSIIMSRQELNIQIMQVANMIFLFLTNDHPLITATANGSR